jgi:hypothetical protein
MFLEEITYRNFVLVHHNWPVETAETILAGPGLFRVIVTRPDPDNPFDLFDQGTIAELLASSDKRRTVLEAIPDNSWPGVPMGRTDDDAETTPYPVIVLDEQGQLVGFYDAEFPTGDNVRNGREVRRQGDRPIGYAIETDYSESVEIGTPFELKIQLDRVRADELTYPFEAETRVHLFVTGCKNLQVIGDPHRKIILSSEQEEGREHIFRFEILPTSVGTGEFVIIICSDSFQGRTREQLQIKEKVDQRRPRNKTHNLYALTGDDTDLDIMIIETPHGGAHLFQFIPVCSGEKRLDLGRSYGPTEIKEAQRADLGRMIFEEFDRVRDYKEPIDWSSYRLRFENICIFFTNQLLPQGLRERIWEHRAQIRSLQIVSNEMDIPWELCRIGPPEGEGKSFFFAEQWPVTRWPHGDGKSDSQPLTDLKLDKVGLVFAPGSGDGAEEEKANLLELFEERSHVCAPDTPSFPEVHQWLNADDYDCWHFVGHSEYNSEKPDYSSMKIDARHTLMPLDLSSTRFSETAPIVFLNSCHTGRTGDAWTDIGGWAKRFLAAGAGAFIGAYWRIKNHHSRYFSEMVYKSLLKGKTIGEAVHRARIFTRDQTGDPTWLAFTVYANPMATAGSDLVEEAIGDVD